MEPNTLLGKLPSYQYKSLLIANNQSVRDIITEVINCHKEFANHYDQIASDFDRGTVREIAKALFDFCKQNIRYKIEPQSMQTTKSPAAIIALGTGDCKHYAGFIAGVLDALKRRGKNIDWKFRFASYNYFDNVPQHVFVVVDDGGKELWIDPVLGSLNQRLDPAYIIDKTVSMPLMRLSGLSEQYPVDTELLDDKDMELDPNLLSAIKILLDYKVLDTQGRVSQDVINSLSKTLPQEKFDLVASAFQQIRTAALGGFLDDVWQGVKMVTLAIPRTAYLQLVLLNFNGMATKLYHVIYDEHNKLRPEAQDVKNKWESLGGNWASLLINVVGGKAVNAVIGCAPGSIGAVQAAAWAVTAAAIIVAMTPIVNSLISKLASQGHTLPTTGLPGSNTPPASTASSIMDWIKANPAIVAVGVVGGYYLFFDKPKKKRA
jgi:hypothetical protein